MGQSILDFLKELIAQYGYWAVGGALLLENTGFPVPGETVLLLASFLSYSRDELQLGYIIVIGICAATLGDNLAFRIDEETIVRGERLFDQFGAMTIFFARFIFGLRVIAGPLAGVLRMPWKRFVIFNFLGALLWVTVISLVGYKFGKHWDQLIEAVEQLNIAIVIAAALGIFILWRWRRAHVGKR